MLRYDVHMRLTEFEQLLQDVFGSPQGRWIAHSHVVSTLGETPDNLIENGYDLARVWRELCDDFSVPEADRLGIDRPGK